MANPAEKFLKPEVIRNVTRLDLRAKFIVEGFLSGLHASPFQGFSVEFSEHRKYSPGDNISDIDWSVFAKTDRFYIKRYQAETNLTGYLLMDLSASMGYTYRQELTKFEYAISLAANGWKKACTDDKALRKGLNVVHGKVVYKGVADAWGLPYFQVEEVLQ